MADVSMEYKFTFDVPAHYSPVIIEKLWLLVLLGIGVKYILEFLHLI